MKRVLAGLILATLTSSATAQGESAPDSSSTNETTYDAGTKPDEPWCAPELEALTDGMCLFTPERESSPRTLVIFLHGVIQLGTTWQWSQERAIARFARRNGVYALTPRGRSDIASKAWRGHWTWPTAVTAQSAVESELFEEWRSARHTVEQRLPAPFEKVLVFGFSNGAYYATSLAFRARFPADGYAVFAGGAAPKHLSRHPPAKNARKPIYVGHGLKDRAHRDPKELAAALRAIGWKHKSLARAKVGHTMTDLQLDDALAFLRGTKRSSR